MRLLRAWPALAIGICIAALAFRMTLGIDLGDESYYAAFVDGWLKTGLNQNRFLMVHQTADLLVYPFAAGFRDLRGTADGLVLFLRFIYLTVASLSAMSLYWAVAPFRGRAIATLVTVFALLFIPFNLPAPSYNTIGMYGSVAALSLFAGGFVRALAPGDAGRRSLPAAMRLSCVWWTGSCVAYPSMLAPLAALLGLALFSFRDREGYRLLIRYAISCGILLAAAFVVLCLLLGIDHLQQMLRFTNAFNNVSGGLGGKVQRAAAVFAAHPRLAVICVASLLVGVMRCLRASRWRWGAEIATMFLVIGVASSVAPGFYSRTHDLVLVLALSGLAPALQCLLASPPDPQRRVFALIYVVSVVGGLTTAATAFNGLFNFPIGGFLAACLALVLPAWSTRTGHGLRVLSIAVACGAMAMTAFTSFYGQIGPFSYRHSVRVEHGAFAGLRTDVDQALFIDRLSEAIEGQRACGDRFAVLGTGPGFYLLTHMAPATLSSWNFAGDEPNLVTEVVRAFYALPTNKPDVLVVNQWQWATPLSSVDRALLEHYVLAGTVVVGIRKASIYRRADCTAVDK